MLRRSVAPVWHAMCAFRAVASRACEAPLTGVMDSRIQTCTWADISIRGGRAGVKRFWRPLILAVVAGGGDGSGLAWLLQKREYSAGNSQLFFFPGVVWCFFFCERGGPDSSPLRPPLVWMFLC